MEHPDNDTIKNTEEKKVPTWVNLLTEESEYLPRICGQRAVVYQNYFYVIQGYDGDYTTDCYCYALDRNEWMPFSTIIADDMEDVGWQYHSVVLDGHTVYIYGGARDNDGENQQICNDVWCIDLRRAVRYVICKNGLSTPRYLHSAVLHEKKMWIFGGRTGSDSESLNELCCFDIETKTWTVIKSTNHPPPARRAHTSFVHDDKIYIFGGWNGTECFNDMWYYDIDLNEWVQVEQKGDVPSEREIECNAEYGGEYYIFGGSSNGKQDNTLYVFNPVTSTWRIVETENKPEERESHVLVAAKNKLIVHGGFRYLRLYDINSLANHSSLDLPVVETKPKNLFEKFQSDMRQLYKSRNKTVFEQLLRVRCPQINSDTIAFESPSPIEEMILEWLFTDSIDEEKFRFQMGLEPYKLFEELLNWSRTNGVTGLADWLVHLATKNINTDTYPDFIRYDSEPIIKERCEWITSKLSDEDFTHPYNSTLQDDMLKLLNIESDVTLQLSNNVTFPLHSWIVDLRCPYFKGSIDFNSLNDQRTKIIKHDPKISTSALESILKYVYSGKLEFLVEDYFEIVKEASYYMIDDEMFYSAMSEEFMKRVKIEDKSKLLELVKKYEGNFLGELQYLKEL